MTERERRPERSARFETLSGIPIEPLYTPASLRDWSPDEQLGRPGEYPFTRGVYPTMYRGRLWTMRMFAGFGRPEDTNARFKYLLAQGQTGLSTAFDMPALMGYDADHPRARGEVGKEGVSISTLDDFERLFADIPLGDVTTSMTINCTASVALAMYLAVAEKQGVAWERVGGTMQNDMLKEFIAQKEWICPPEPAVRIVVDMIEFTSKHVPRFNPVSISGYHIREAGATAVQELAFTLADGLGYVEAAREYIRKIDAMGGIVRAIDTGYPQREIADAAYRYQLMEDRRDKVVVGVNKYVMPEERPINYLKIDAAVEREQLERVGRLKAARDGAKVERRLKQLAEACRERRNVMPVLIDAVKDYVSLGEISDVYRQVFGLYREPIIF